jgi:PAS domain S-box-containing protein
LSLAGSVILKHQVNARTRELRLINLELEKEVRMRREAEEILRAGERKYRLLTDNTLDVIWAMDSDLKFTYVNPAIRSLLGYSPDEWIGTRLQEHCDEENFAKIVQVIADETARGPDAEGFILEAVLLNKNQRPIPFEIDGKVNYDEKGEPKGIQGVARDVSERKESEKAIKKSAEKYRMLIENAGQVVLVVQDGRFAFVNNRVLNLLGYTPEELTGKPFVDYLHPEDKAKVAERHVKRLQGEDVPPLYSFRVIDKEGEIKWLEISAVQIEWEEKPATLNFLTDITERKEAEKALRDAESRYRLHFENVSDVIYSVDRELRLVDISPSVESVLGYKPEALIGRPFQDLNLLAPEYLEKAAFDTMRVLGGERISSTEYQFITREGTMIWGEVSGAPLIREGQVVAVVSVARDITGRKRAEEEHEKLESQLRQAQKMEAVGVLAGGVAHDFNNILTTILGNAQLIMADLKKDDPVYEDVNEIRKAGDRAAALTRQLLAFSRRQIIEPSILGLNNLINGMEKMLKRLIREDIELKISLCSDACCVRVDPVQMDQVIMNLVVNAADAMPKGGMLTLETARINLDSSFFKYHGVEKEPGPYMMLVVSDTGAGMDREIQSRIFEPFFTTKEKGKGTGLGLSTVYGIVKQNDGFIWAYSEPGKGTSFKIYLPEVRGDEEPMDVGKSEPKDLSGNETILVVEDDEMLIKFIRKTLNVYGYRLLEARNGEEALEVSARHKDPIHLILTDVVMPRMSGLELVQRMEYLRPETRVVFMSGYTDDTIFHHGLLKEGLSFIEKPFTPEGLVRKVREVLDTG